MNNQEMTTEPQALTKGTLRDILHQWLRAHPHRVRLNVSPGLDPLWEVLIIHPKWGDNGLKETWAEIAFDDDLDFVEPMTFSVICSLARELNFEPWLEAVKGHEYTGVK